MVFLQEAYAGLLDSFREKCAVHLQKKLTFCQDVMSSSVRDIQTQVNELVSVYFLFTLIVHQQEQGFKVSLHCIKFNCDKYNINNNRWNGNEWCVRDCKMLSFYVQIENGLQTRFLELPHIFITWYNVDQLQDWHGTWFGIYKFSSNIEGEDKSWHINQL